MLFTLIQSVTQFFDPGLDPTLDPTVLLGGFFIIYLVIIIIACVISLVLTIWVYKDAKKRDMNASVWLLIVLLTGCIGCIIYLVVRD